MPEMHGCLLIGAGKAGTNFIEASELVPQLPIIAVADTDETNRERAAARMGHSVRVGPDYREFLDDTQVESALIATPNYLHEQHTIEAMQAGKHVLVEKPLAISLESCDRIIAAQKQTGQNLQVGLELRHDLTIRKLQKLIASGMIGPIHMMWHNTFRPPFLKKVDDWVVKSDKSGGAITEKLVHQFDLFNATAKSRPVRVAAFGGADAVYGEDWLNVKPDVIDNAWILIEYENGVRGCAGICFFSQGVENAEFGIIGREGRLDCYERQGRIEFVDRQGAARATYNIHVPAHIRRCAHGGPGYYQAMHWLNVLEGTANAYPTTGDGKLALAVALAAERSIHSGNMEKVSA